MRRFTWLLAACSVAFSSLVFADSTSIVTWGDSLTAGAHASSPSKAYPAELGRLLARTVANGGVGGETSREIAARQGGAPALLTFQGNVLTPRVKATTTKVSTFPITPQGPQQLWGTIAGVHGTLSAASDSRGNRQLAFKQDGMGQTVVVTAKTPFLPDTYGTESWINVFWLGHMNRAETDQVVSDTAACVQSLTTGHYVVLSVLTDASEGVGTWGHNNAAALNGRLSQMFPGHFLDVRKALIDAYDPKLPQDVADHAADTVPASLRSDIIHLNDKGYAIVAARVAAFVTQRGW